MPAAATDTAVPLTPTAESRSAETPTPTWTIGATSTASPTPSQPATPTPSASSGQGSIVFVGCAPQPSEVKVEFLPLGMFDASGRGAGTPSGAAISVPAVQVQSEPQKFTFQPPATADAGRVYQVQTKVEDPQCALDASSTKSYWLAGAGADVKMPLVHIGDTTLEASNNADKPPKPLPQVKGVFIEFGKEPRYGDLKPVDTTTGWATEFTFYGDQLKGRKQRFRWSTDLTSAISGTLQVSWLPFGNTYQGDPFSPPGLLASWPVDCTACEFIVDLSPLPLPDASGSPSGSAGGSWLEKIGQIVMAPFKAVGNFVADIGNALAGLLGGGSKQAPPKTVPKANVAPSNPTVYKASNPINPISYQTLYFRVLPLNAGTVVGDASNSVIFHWGGKQDPLSNIKITNPTATPSPTPSAYEVQISSYHGVIPPKGGCPEGFGGYIVTQDTWFNGFTYSTDPIGGSSPALKKGKLLCPPTEQEGKSILDTIGSWVEGAINLASEAYNGLKNTVISAVGTLLPDALCDNSCVGFILDATLVAMGIPPDIPNFDDLMSQGLDYVAQQAVAQIGIPPEVLNQTGPYAGMALQEAEAKFKEEAQSKIKDGLQKGATQMQLASAKSAGYIPAGIPARPDDYLPPAMTVKVTRKPGVPGGDKGCTVEVSDYLLIPQSALDNPPPGWANALKGVNDRHKLHSGNPPYDFFAGTAKLAVPPLAPGQSVEIPYVFKPNVWDNGWHPLGTVDTSYYFTAWRLMHELGTVHLSASGCGSDQLDVSANASVVGMEVKPGGN